MIKEYKEILKEKNAKALLKKGINDVTELVKKTYGAKGKKVIIDAEYSAPEACDDGITVLSRYEAKDPKMQLGVKLVKQAAAKTNDVKGDGTTTTVILANELINSILPDEEGGKILFGKQDDILKIRRGINSGLAKVIEYINTTKLDVTTDEQIVNVGTISSNDESIGIILRDIFKKLGREAAVTVEESKGLDTTYDVTEGLSFDRGYISPYMITDPETELSTLPVAGEHANILVIDQKINTLEQIQGIAHLVNAGCNDLVIICDDLGEQALATLIFNKVQGRIRFVAVKAPGYGNQSDSLEDIAIRVGTKVINNISDIQIKDITRENSAEFIGKYVGKAQKVVVSKDKTIIIGGAGKEEEIKERITTLENRVEQAQSQYDKEKLKERIAKLVSGVATIKVGGATEQETGDKKAKIIDAVNAVKSALADGIVAGGGVIMYDARKVLDTTNAGEKIVYDALSAPIRYLLENADLTAEPILATIDGKDMNWGYNVEKDEIVNMIDAGIIDPAGVIISALQNAVSVALTVLAVGGAIVNIRDEKEDKEMQQV